MSDNELRNLMIVGVVLLIIIGVILWWRKPKETTKEEPCLSCQDDSLTVAPSPKLNMTAPVDVTSYKPLNDSVKYFATFGDGSAKYVV